MQYGWFPSKFDGAIYGRLGDREGGRPLSGLLTRGSAALPLPGQGPPDCRPVPLRGVIGDMNHPVVHFEINVYNAKRSREFYRKLFGWKIAKIYKRMSHAVIHKTGVGGIGGGIAGTNSRGVTMYVRTNNIEAVFKKVKKLGGRVTRKVMEIPGMGRIGWFRDQAGNELGLWSPQR